MLNMPKAGIVDAYEALLVSNLGSVQSIESGLRNVTWLLPGRFQDAELASEGLYAGLNMLSGYHDELLSKHLDPSLSLPPHPFVPPAPGPKEDPPISRTTPVLPPPSDHARYTKYWMEKSGLYRKASRLLTTLNYVDLLVEMLAKKQVGDRRRWNFLLGIESFKTLLRLIILAVTRRPVLNPTAPQREYDLLNIPSSLLRSAKSKLESKTEKPSPVTSSGAASPADAVTATLPPFAPLRSHLFPLANALPESHLAHPLSLLPELKTPGQWTAAVIESSINLVHIALLVRAARRSKSRQYSHFSLPTLSSKFGPWLLPLLLALFARQLRRKTTSDSLLLAEHNAALDRRLAAKAFFTGPMWVGWTRPKVVGIAKALERIPIIGLFGELIDGYVPLLDDYFYYSS